MIMHELKVPNIKIIPLRYFIDYYKGATIGGDEDVKSFTFRDLMMLVEQYYNRLISESTLFDYFMVNYGYEDAMEYGHFADELYDLLLTHAETHFIDSPNFDDIIVNVDFDGKMIYFIEIRSYRVPTSVYTLVRQKTTQSNDTQSGELSGTDIDDSLVSCLF